MTTLPLVKNPKIKRKKHRKRRKKQKSVPLLVFSSLVFITNVITALYIQPTKLILRFYSDPLGDFSLRESSNTYRYASGVLRKPDFIYASLFALLTATSIAFHSKIPIMQSSIAILDKLTIYSIVCYGFWSLCNLNLEPNMGSYLWRGLILSTFGFCIWVFYYGYMTKSLCYHPNKKISNHYHALLHLIGSIGHHMIILSKN